MKIFKLFSLTLLVFLLTQCYPDGFSYVEETDIVISNYDPEYNFAAKMTYAMPAKIVIIDDDLIGGGQPHYVDPVVAGPILSQIQKDMTSYGWTRVEADKNPDVLLWPSSLESTLVVYDYWGYWGYWYGGYYPTVSTYQIGSLMVTMVDPNDKNADGKPRIAWGFVANGLLEGSTASITSRYTNGVDQGFKQSSYIKK